LERLASIGPECDSRTVISVRIALKPLVLRDIKRFLRTKHIFDSLTILMQYLVSSTSQTKMRRILQICNTLMFDAPNSSRHLRNVPIPSCLCQNCKPGGRVVLSQPHASDLGAWPWTLDVAPQQLRALNVTILYITPRRIARLSEHRPILCQRCFQIGALNTLCEADILSLKRRPPSLRILRIGVGIR
jgi:hypothetical protein